MSKKIEVEFCGESGLGGSVLKLKNKIMEAFPGVQIERIEASSATNRIEVFAVATIASVCGLMARPILIRTTPPSSPSSRLPSSDTIHNAHISY